MIQHKVILLLGILSSVCWAHDDTSFREDAISILYHQLQQTDPILLSDLLTRIANKTGLSPSESRHRLQTLVDSLEIQRRQETGVWQGIISLRTSEVSPKTADKFMTLLLKETRKFLKTERNFSLTYITERLAKKVKLPVDGQDFLRQVFAAYTVAPTAEISATAQTTQSIIKAMPNNLGLLVEVHDLVDYEYLRRVYNAYTGDPTSQGAYAFTFFRTRDPSVVLAKFRQAPASILSDLLQSLPESSYIKWSVDKPTSLLEPDYLCSLELTYIAFNRIVGQTTKNPCVWAIIKLQHIPSTTWIYTIGLRVGTRINSHF